MVATIEQIGSIQDATLKAFQTYHATKPTLELDIKSLYNDDRIRQLLGVMDEIIPFCFPKCAGVDYRAMFENYADRMKDFKGNDVMAWRIVSAFQRDVLKMSNPEGLKESNWRDEWTARGGRPYTVIQPAPRAVQPSPTPTPTPKPVPEVQTPTGYFDVDTFLEFYEDEPETVEVVKEVPVQVEPEPPKEGEVDPFKLDDELMSKFFDWERKLIKKAVRGQLIYLWGPPGVGKSYFPMKLADMLEIPVIIIQAVSMPEVLIGTLDINGNIQRTKFNQAIQIPCVIIFEEIDSWNGKTREALMPFLANGTITFDDGQTIRKHPQCLIFGTGNTNMMGPTREHPNRERIDQAFIDRWRFKRIAYDHDTAESIATHDYPKFKDIENLLSFGEDYERARVATKSGGLAWTYRPMLKIIDDLMADDGDTLAEIINDNLVKDSVSIDTLNRIIHAMNVNNKYTKALRELVQ